MTHRAVEAEQMRMEDELGPVIEADRVQRRFKDKMALEDVSLDIGAGEIHALLGPNGAGKTTLLRILAGLVEPSMGEVRILGGPSHERTIRLDRGLLGIVPSGDRTFYLPLSGLENLIFFARLYGFRLREARARARECLEAVGLTDAIHKRVGLYSHGMQKRLAVARALLVDPPIMLVDEATQGLDPAGARRVKDLVSAAAARGTAVLWTTQQIDEIRGFAHRVTVLHAGAVRFVGSVPQLMARSRSRRYFVHLETSWEGDGFLDAAHSVLGEAGRIVADRSSSNGHYRLWLQDDAILGDALTALTTAGIRVLGCREERSTIEDAFLDLTEAGP